MSLSLHILHAVDFLWCFCSKLIVSIPISRNLVLNSLIFMQRDFFKKTKKKERNNKTISKHMEQKDLKALLWPPCYQESED